MCVCDEYFICSCQRSMCTLQTAPQPSAEPLKLLRISATKHQEVCAKCMKTETGASPSALQKVKDLKDKRSCSDKVFQPLRKDKDGLSPKCLQTPLVQKQAPHAQVLISVKSDRVQTLHIDIWGISALHLSSLLLPQVLHL